MLPELRRAILLVAVLCAAVLLLSCGSKKESAGTPEASAGGNQTPEAEAVPGVTDTEILLGAHFPLSQTPAAAYAPVADGMRAYFDHINSQGGIYGRKIKFLVQDDHFNPSDATEVTRKLVEQDHIFAMIGGLGDVAHAAVYKYLEEEGVPDMFIGGGTVAFTDPVAHTRFAGNPDYYTEGMMLGKYIAEHYNGKKLALLLENDTFGSDGKTGIMQGLEGSDVQVVSEETYEGIAFDVTPQTIRLKAANPDVIAAYAIPPPAASLVKTARETLNWDVPIVVSGVDLGDIFVQLAGVQNAEGVVSVGFGKHIYQTDDLDVQEHIRIMKEFGQGVEPSNFTLYGHSIAELIVKALENAGADLTRESLIEGAESIRDFCCTLCLYPVNLSPTDHRPFEKEIYHRLENGKWEPFGEPIDVESTPGNAIACAGKDNPVYPTPEGQ